MVSIITVNFKQRDVTLALLRSIQQYRSEDEPIEVIVVDNGSEVDCGADFRETMPDVVYIRSERNLGFAGGNNLGITHAHGKYLLFLNNDTEVTDNLIIRLKRELDDRPEIGLISPLLLYFDNKGLIQYAGYGPMNYLTGRNRARGNQELDTGQYDDISEETGYCHGAAMMCRTRDLEKVGFMDERYFLYYEELDWCEKFRRAGLKSWFSGAAKIYHKESVTVGRETPIKTYFMARNRMLFIRKNTGWWNTFWFTLFFMLLASTKQAIVYIAKGRFDLLTWHYRGVWWNLTHASDSNNLGFKLT